MSQASGRTEASKAQRPGEQVAAPAVIRGLTERSLSRRTLFRCAGTGAGAPGLAAMLEACGVKGAAPTAAGAKLPNSGAGTPAWWREQQLHHTVNVANWPIYIDTLNGKHPTLRYFTEQTGIKVGYSEPETDPMPFYTKLRALLQAGQPTGYDVIVITDNTPVWGFLKANGWLIPLDHSMMTNFGAYASPLVKSPRWDPGNRYGMAWQSGWTAVGYNASVIPDPGDSIQILFDKKYAGMWA